MTASSSSTACNTTQQVGNACRPCSVFSPQVAGLTCPGLKDCPGLNCTIGTYLPAGGTKCIACKPGYFCPVDSFCPLNSLYDCPVKECPPTHPNSDEGATSINDCYKEETIPWTGSQKSCSLPTYCATVTCASCSISSCTKRTYYDGRVVGCTSNNEPCQQTVASVTAKTGAYVASSGKSCTRCSAGTYQGVDKFTGHSCSDCIGRTKFSAAGAAACSTVSSGYYTTGCNTSGNRCTGQSACGGNTYYCTGGIRYSVTTGYYTTGGTTTTHTGQSPCTGATYCTGGVKYNCPTYYDDDLSDKKTSASQCVQTCIGGTHVITAKKKCEEITSGNIYIETHDVSYGDLSPDTKDCPDGYIIKGTEYTDHDSIADCGIGCPAGTQVVNPGEECTTPAGSWYTSAHTVTADGTSGDNVKSCPAPEPVQYTGDAWVDTTNVYETPNTTEPTNHDELYDCRIDCRGSYVMNPHETCIMPKNQGHWYKDIHYVNWGDTSEPEPCWPDFYNGFCYAGNANEEPGCRDSVDKCFLRCGPGQYYSYPNNPGCHDVGEGYWGPGGAGKTQNDFMRPEDVPAALPRNPCPEGLTTPGFGIGADELADCGRILWTNYVNGNGIQTKYYLRTEQRSYPTLKFEIDNRYYYLDLVWDEKYMFHDNEGLWRLGNIPYVNTTDYPVGSIMALDDYQESLRSDMGLAIRLQIPQYQ